MCVGAKKQSFILLFSLNDLLRKRNHLMVFHDYGEYFPYNPHRLLSKNEDSGNDNKQQSLN